MRIAIATVRVPFVSGGAEIHAEELRHALTAHGHEAEIFAIPFKWYPPEAILDHMLACRLLDLTEAQGKRIDALIGLKFPAYLMNHPNKVLWVLHQHRQAYDLWNDPVGGDMIHDENGVMVREAIVNADRLIMPCAREIFANSRNVALRLHRFCEIDAQVLYHPPRSADLFYREPAERWLFFPSRIMTLKRQELVVRALAKTKARVAVKFAGVPDDADYLLQLRKLASKLGVADRAEWLGGVSEEVKRELYAKCLGVVYPPLDEDFGYVTLEAMLSSKPVITCSDSGGPREFVEPGVSGFVAAPTPESLAEAMDALWADTAAAERFGRAGLAKYRSCNISWDNVVSNLLRSVKSR